jgi:hypothetical protein
VKNVVFFSPHNKPGIKKAKKSLESNSGKNLISTSLFKRPVKIEMIKNNCRSVVRLKKIKIPEILDDKI